MVAGQKVALGRAHQHQTVTVARLRTTLAIELDDGETRVVRRTTTHRSRRSSPGRHDWPLSPESHQDRLRHRSVRSTMAGVDQWRATAGAVVVAALLLGACSNESHEVDVELYHCGVLPLKVDAQDLGSPPPTAVRRDERATNLHRSRDSHHRDRRQAGLCR